MKTHIMNEFKNETYDDFLNYKINLLTKVIYIGIFFTLTTAIMMTLNIQLYPWHPLQESIDYIYVMLTVGLLLFLRKNKLHYTFVAHCVIFLTFLLCCTAFIFMPEDNFRAIWFYIIVFLSFILLENYMGFIYTILAITVMIITELFLDIHLSELTLNSSIFALIIFSLLFSSYTKQLLNYEQTLEEKNNKLQLLTTLDGLTGIFNKRAFSHIAKSLFSEHTAKNKALFFLLIDMDHFKSVNDTYGHDAGDEVLKQCTKTISKLIESEAVFARVGGEEFALLVPNINVDEGYILAEKILDGSKALQIQYNEHIIQITVSIGIAQRQQEDHSFLNLYTRADKALYKAKKAGRDQYVYLA